MAKKAKQLPNTEPIVQQNDTASARHHGFCYWDDDVLVLNVLGTPSAKRDVIGKLKGDQLKIAVTKEPENGKATDHMVSFLAREFGVKSSQIEVVFGRLSINKQLRISAPKKLPKVISSYLQQLS